MLRGVRIGSIGFKEREGRIKGYQEARTSPPIHGEGEAELVDILSKPSAEITRREAQEILGGEMNTADFIKKHSESLLIWDDEEKLGTVRG